MVIKCVSFRISILFFFKICKCYVRVRAMRLHVERIR